jgi:hypothetical protein
VALVNGERAASKLPLLRNSAGLGCMALQYISECMATATAAACNSDDTVAACQPPEAHVTEVYAANCGVELPTVDIISGRLLGCCDHREDVAASASGNGTRSRRQVMLAKEHSQVGAALDRHGRHGPFFWCLLFSSGSANSTFLLDAGGKGIHQNHGCFSAAPDDTTSCNAAASSAGAGAGAVAALLLPLIFRVLS